MSTIVQLSKDEIRVCSMLGVERWLTTRGSGLRDSYKEGKANGSLEHQMLADVRTICAEWAVAKYYGWTWNVPWWPKDEHPKRKNLPDVGEKGEVRTVRTKSSIPYWLADKGKLIIGCKVIDEEYFSEVEIYGKFQPIFDDAHLSWDETSYRWSVDQCRL